MRDLAIPPAWSEVWICPWPNGHLQATGRDAAGRLQYLYHPAWRRRMDAAKFRHMTEFGSSLPAARRRVSRDLSLPDMPRDKALAIGFRLLDLGAIRIGGEEYARVHGTVGIATLRRDHVSTSQGRSVMLSFPGKGGRQHSIEIIDAPLASAVRVLLARRSGGRELLAYRQDEVWHDIKSADLNAYLKQVTGFEATAKDFRTWHANVELIAYLCASGPAETVGQRSARLKGGIKHVAAHLGNTPAVARASYIDPRLSEHYENGRLDCHGVGLGDGARTLESPERLLLQVLADA